MSPPWAAPPAADRCLDSSYASRGPKGQKGGTLVDSLVLTLAAHEERLKNPSSYLPKECKCGCPRLRLHDLRTRILRGTLISGGGFAVVIILVFLCTGCSATWRVLPAFLARHLWRTWETVATAVAGERKPGQAQVPKRTRQRWRARLGQAARTATQVLASSGDAALRAVAQQVGLEALRQELVTAFAAAFTGGVVLLQLAELLHRLAPGIRLM